MHDINPVKLTTIINEGYDTNIEISIGYRAGLLAYGFELCHKLKV